MTSVAGIKSGVRRAKEIASKKGPNSVWSCIQLQNLSMASSMFLR